MMKKAYLTVFLGLIVSSQLVSSSFAFDVEVSEAPTTDLSLVVSAIESAQSTLLINIYELSSPQIGDAVVGRIRAGVHVEILEEGQPVGGMSAAQKGVEAQIVQAMSSQDHFYEMTSKATSQKVNRRFRYDHAKYVIVDGSSLVIGSENYSPTGNAAPGTLGNRGWEVFIHDEALAEQFQSTFASDTSTQYGDILEIKKSSTQTSLSSKKAPVFSAANPVLTATSVNNFMSPTTSQAGLLGMINGAEKTLDIEQMTFNSTWGKNPGDSPLYDAVIAAARRGVKVRVLLNDETVFDHPSKPSKPVNRLTYADLNELAKKDDLPLTVRIANLKAMGVDYIHNKGALVDGNETLISSINWDENSIENNRETAVVIKSPAVNAHYLALFTQDWDNSATAAAADALETPAATTRAPAFVAQTDTSCPTAMNVQIQIGELTVTGADDPDFQSLSNTKFSGSFERSFGQSGCVLAQSDQTATAIAAHRFMEVRTDKDGSKMIILEGYTPISQKLYSVRAHVPADISTLSGLWTAKVYDASGAGKESLGEASMALSISQQ
jgi:phosphatidylserine/phosphatidylglycerophosphate/cardiolipin synthase-like enzyme